MHDRTLTEISQALDAGEISSRELTQDLLGRIDRLDGTLNSFVSVTADQALETAEAADQARAR
ncbi:MAG TPA: Asp-tRNA(Asn)/Glu-tRNA(Gln) amidotransferase GatCAB subunit A, partial [Cobetia sp.]|nr:Asp-tRNA(Asn)/Glu-tRNA(Gln) amidotransferase GatCAB subunit A [Cobetia sp.]